MLARIYKYHHEVNSYDVVKFVAILAMIIDHVGFYFVDNNDYFRAIGRLAAPLFFFITGHVSNYNIRSSILIYGLIIMGVSYYWEGVWFINILLVFVGIKWILNRWDPSQENIIIIIVIFLLLYFLSSFTRSVIEYGLFGLAYAICGRLLASRTKMVVVSVLLAGTLFNQFYYYLFFDDIYLSVLISMVGISLFYIMLFFQYQVFSVHPMSKNSILVVSRYSLEIYFWHLLMFEIVSKLILAQ